MVFEDVMLTCPPSSLNCMIRAAFNLSKSSHAWVWFVAYKFTRSATASIAQKEHVDVRRGAGRKAPHRPR